MNYWVRKQTLKPGDTDGSWKGLYRYNADRRTANAFDPATDTMTLSLGSRTITLRPGEMTAKSGRFTFTSDKGVTPQVKVLVDPRSQTVKLSSRKDTLADGVPGTVRTTTMLGDRGYRLETFLDQKGRFTATSGYRNTAFVVDKAKVSSKGPGKDVIKIAMLLGDPAFTYESGVSELRFRVLRAGSAIFDKTFTQLVLSKEGVDRKTGAVFTMMKRIVKDEAVTDTLTKFAYHGKTGQLILIAKNADLSALVSDQEHVGVEITVGDRVYYTSVTLFAGKRGTYSTKM